MTLERANEIVGKNQPFECIVNMVKALRLMTWLNDADDWERLEAAEVVLRDRRRQQRRRQQKRGR